MREISMSTDTRLASVPLQWAAIILSHVLFWMIVVRFILKAMSID